MRPLTALARSIHVEQELPRVRLEQLSPERHRLADEGRRESGAGIRDGSLTRPAPSPYSCFMDWRSRITIEPGKRGGKSCIRGLRITVSEVLEYLASGMTEDEILRDFPDLTREDIRACLAFAADRERKFVSVPPA